MLLQKALKVIADDRARPPRRAPQRGTPASGRALAMVVALCLVGAPTGGLGQSAPSPAPPQSGGSGSDPSGNALIGFLVGLGWQPDQARRGA